MSGAKSVDLDELARMHSTDECPLDRWNRYLIVPAGATDKRCVPHTRATTVAKALDDGHGIAAWERRLTAVGFAQNPTLFAELCAALPADGEDLDKGRIDSLCDKAKVKAGGDEARDKGTVLHAFSEQVDRGRRPVMPAAFGADIDAYCRKLDEMEIRIVAELVERYVVNPNLAEPVAGKCDRYVHFGSTLKPADLKTGSLGRWSWLAWAIQLAIYANAATFYDAKTKTHEPLPPVDLDTGLIFHLPAGQARCDVYFIDLAAGWAAAQMAVAVRKLRKLGESGDLAEIHTTSAVVNVDVRRARLQERVVALIEGGLDWAVAAAWPEGVAYFGAVRKGTAPPHTAAELDLIAMAISVVENRAQTPFGPPDPADR